MVKYIVGAVLLIGIGIGGYFGLNAYKENQYKDFYTEVSTVCQSQPPATQQTCWNELNRLFKYCYDLSYEKGAGNVSVEIGNKELLGEINRVGFDRMK